jgi:formylglycine-generating enzyme required for sulfatase activity
MAPLRLTCPRCQARLTTQDPGRLSRAIACPRCGTSLGPQAQADGPAGWTHEEPPPSLLASVRLWHCLLGGGLVLAGLLLVALVVLRRPVETAGAPRQSGKAAAAGAQSRSSADEDNQGDGRPGARGATAGGKYALLVGVRDYDSSRLAPLQFTENDAEELGEVLAKRAGFSVRVLTSSRGEKSKSEAPTEANLRAELRKLLGNRSKHDTILVALSGHGIQATVKDAGKEKDESFFCPSDAQLNDHTKLIALSQLFADLDGCGAGVKLLLVDACRNDPKQGRNVDVDSLPRLPRGTAALFSCKSGERAFESPKAGKGHGVFFYHVIEGLRGKAENTRGEVTWNSLVDHVTEAVSDEVPKLIGGGARQTPELKVNLLGKPPVLVKGDGRALVKKDVPEKKEDLHEKKKPVKEDRSWLTNSVGMKLVRIPAGKFLLGSSKREQDAVLEDCVLSGVVSPDVGRWVRAEGPLHEVEITRPFYMGTFEVTQRQYRKVMGSNPSWFAPRGGGREKVKGRDTEDFPVEMVSWEDALELCKRLSDLPAEKEAGRSYRLPTEAEWEHACRASGPPSRAFHHGSSISGAQANFDAGFPYGGGKRGRALGRTCEVGSYEPNAWGLYDMHGNVYEWCADGYSADYYRKSPRQDPRGPADGGYPVMRGGSWVSHGRFCRSAFRNGVAPETRSWDLGVRVVCEVGGR